MRVSDAERESVVAQLQRATTEGRLTLDELGDRIAAAYEAKTWPELDELVDDLPWPPTLESLDDPPAPPASNARSFAVPVLAVAAIPVSFQSPLGVMLSLAAILLGVLALGGPARKTTAQRAAIVAGVVIGLLPPVFFATVLLLLG